MLHLLLAQIGGGEGDNIFDTTVGLSLLSQSVDLSQKTAESWNEIWGEVVSSSSPLWAGLCAFGTFLAAVSLVLTSLKIAGDYQEWRFQLTDLISSLIWPLTIAIFLGNNGNLLSETVQIVRAVGHDQVVKVLNIQVADTTFKNAIASVSLSQNVKQQVSAIYAECTGKTGQELNACLSEKQPVVEQILQEASQYGSIESGKNFAELGKNIFQNPGEFFASFISLVLVSFLWTLQWAFVNVLEAALLMTATFAPIAMGLSLLPLGARPIWAWASGFASLFGVQIGYNILVGLAATVIVKAGGQSASDLGFLAFISIFAPALAVAIASGGGLSLYWGIANNAPMLARIVVDAASSGVGSFASNFEKAR